MKIMNCKFNRREFLTKSSAAGAALAATSVAVGGQPHPHPPAWWEQILTPLSIQSDTSSPAGYRQAKELRERFMGNASTEGAQAGAPPVIPEAPAPENGPQGKQPSTGQKLRLGRGCS
jgi:hypothetical protein